METTSFGFIGGGRITRILLKGWERAGKLPEKIVVSETSAEVLDQLKAHFPAVDTTGSDSLQPAAQKVVFLALHPPAIPATLAQIQPCLQPDTVIVSLAPKLSIAKLSELLGGFGRIVRMIPNAPSIINEGYNPVTFSSAFTAEEKQEITALLEKLGACPEVDERKLEAYAVIAAMGPTYLWFQWNELQSLAESFGLGHEEAAATIQHMVTGAVNTLYQSGLTPADVMNLVPAKPLGEDETQIQQIYRAKLGGIYGKLTS